MHTPPSGGSAPPSSTPQVDCEAARRFQLAIEGSGDGIWDWDLRSDSVYYSPRWKALLGHTEQEVGTSPVEWQHRLHAQDRAAAMAALEACLSGRKSSFYSEHRLRCRNGDWKWVQMRAAVTARDHTGSALRLTGTMSDISRRRLSEERVWQHANFDALTNLPNRRLFRDRLEQEVKKAQRNGQQIGLMFIDLDRFKEVNDLLGHDAGDMLLIQAAQRLAACVRDSDTVARLGGDEFTVILPGLETLEATGKIADKILHTLGRPFQLGNEVAYLSGSLGITIFPDDAASPEELIRNADQAMYGAKHAGRNQFRYFTRSMQEKAHARLRLATELRGALAAGQLQVHYQPVVDLASGRITKAEALLRWQHPTLGQVDPALFVPLAEESGLIVEIGEWVFRQAAACARRWSEQLGSVFQIGVNKSPVQFMATEAQDDWGSHLQAMGLSGNCIAVEITEGMLLNASPNVAAKLLAYRDAGIQVAIDDFGTGYSSMAYLKKFDIDYLKIDRSFVRDMASDETDRAIAESVIVMAHRLGLKVIAEGIETREQMELLTAAGCDFGQGFLYARATPAEEFERMLRGAQRQGGSLH